MHVAVTWHAFLWNMCFKVHCQGIFCAGDFYVASPFVAGLDLRLWRTVGELLENCWTVGSRPATWSDRSNPTSNFSFLDVPTMCTAPTAPRPCIVEDVTLTRCSWRRCSEVGCRAPWAPPVHLPATAPRSRKTRCFRVSFWPPPRTNSWNLKKCTDSKGILQYF